jgi:hypothetical protein
MMLLAGRQGADKEKKLRKESQRVNVFQKHPLMASISVEREKKGRKGRVKRKVNFLQAGNQGCHASGRNDSTMTL